MTERPNRRVLLLWVLSLAIGAGLALGGLELAAGFILRSRLANSLTIFECILCDGKNVLTPKAHYQGVWETAAFKVALRTNNQGYREDFDFRDDEVEVAFMGDSFTFGQGVSVEERYSNIAGTHFNSHRVVSLSYNNGFQPEHYEYFLDRHPDLKPRLIFVGLYLGNDLDSDLRETVIERGADGSISSIALPYRGVYHGALTNSTAYRYSVMDWLVSRTNLGKILAVFINASPRLRQAFRRENETLPNTTNRLSTEMGEFDAHNLRAIAALKRIAERQHASGGELHVLLIPQNFMIGSTALPHADEALGGQLNQIRAKGGIAMPLLGICKTAGLQCHDLSGLLTEADYLAADGHWNASGHARVGAFCARIIESVLAR